MKESFLRGRGGRTVASSGHPGLYTDSWDYTARPISKRSKYNKIKKYWFLKSQNISSHKQAPLLILQNILLANQFASISFPQTV